MNLILQAIKSLFRKVEASMPKKLSDLVNDLKFPTPDWNQNDPEGEGYIANRPFYEESTEVVWVEDQTITVDDYGRANIVYDADLTPMAGLAFVVVFDGVSYTGITSYDADTCVHTDFTTANGESVQIYDGAAFVGPASLAGEHAIKIVYTDTVTTQIPERFVPQKVLSVNGKTGYVNLTAANVGAASTASVTAKMDKSNPTGTGYFSMNGLSGSTKGSYSHAVGFESAATGNYSSAEGYRATASGSSAHAEGAQCAATGDWSHAEGFRTIASGVAAHAEGYGQRGLNNDGAHGKYSHVEGLYTKASGVAAHAEGHKTVAIGDYQHVQGKYNLEDADGKYAHIVGNGAPNANSNAHTLDWDGNAWFAGTVEGTALILPSSTEGSTKKFKITVDDSGTLTATEIVEDTTTTE